MKPESLKALGAVPLDEETARQLGLTEPWSDRLSQIRDRLPEVIGETSRVIIDNPAPFLLSACGSYVLTRALINLVKPEGMTGILACGIVSYAASTIIMGELLKRDLLTVRDDDGCECGGSHHERVPEDLTVRQVYERGGHYDAARNEFVMPDPAGDA